RPTDARERAGHPVTSQHDSMPIQPGDDARAGALYRIEHETRYVHLGRVSTSQHVAWLQPRALPRQRLHLPQAAIDPPPASATYRVGRFGNALRQFAILTPYSILRVTSRSLVEVLPRQEPVQPDESPAWEDVRDAARFHRGTRPDESAEFRYESPYVTVA